PLDRRVIGERIRLGVFRLLVPADLEGAKPDRTDGKASFAQRSRFHRRTLSPRHPRRSLASSPPLRKGGQGGSHGAVIRLCWEIDRGSRGICRAGFRTHHMAARRMICSQRELYHKLTRPPRCPPLTKGGEGGALRALPRPF